MRYLILIILLFTSNLEAAPSTEGCTSPLNLKYSFKDFSNQSFKTVSASEFNGTCIKGSSFYQEAKFDDVIILKDIFPRGMKNVEFVRCNLDNVKVVANNIVGSRSVNRRIKVQNDFEDWILDANNNPKEPIGKELRIKRGISINPKDIPIKKFTKEQHEIFSKSMRDPGI